VDLIHYRIANEHTVTKTDSHSVETKYGEFIVHSYKDLINGGLHLAFSKGDIAVDDPTLVRVHIPNTMRDVCEVFNGERTSWSFNTAMEKISKEGKGVAVLLSGDDYSQDIADNLASVLAVGNEVSATSRPGSDLTIGTGSQILRDLGVGKMRLLSYPAKYPAISGFDLEVVEFVQFEK
jgi:3,4-dihydroxy 2-butanone 4-phosphate synthase/GTP cyclohydrolase II